MYLYILDGNYIEKNCYKIGKTNDPNSRKSNLKSGCPYKLQYIKLFKTEEDIESFIHNKLDDKRMNRGGGTKWFILDDINI